MEHILKFHLDVFSLRYSNYPQVSYLGMNPGRGWNLDLEESYLLEYNESEAETFTDGSLGIYLWPVKVSAPDTYPILRYSECTKTISFSILGFSSLKP